MSDPRALYPGWEPVEEVAHDVLTAGPVARLAALLDTDAAHWPRGELPPLAHWLFFLPQAPQSALAADGHPHRGGLLPPIDAPRRMWAGGRVDFLRPLPIGAAATRRSIVVAASRKEGRSGTLDFVTVRHEISVAGETAVVEEQDLVFRDSGAGAPPPATPDPRVAAASRAMTADITQLFRYSALTFNAHRIHYDHAFATEVEGYPGLVVHGPYQATLLADHLLRTRPDARLRRFEYRGVRPLFADTRFTLNLTDDGAEVALWTSDAGGAACMTARASITL